jgi:hypothetical protein
MPLLLEFDSAESSEKIVDLAWNNPEATKRRGQIIELQQACKLRIAMTLQRLLRLNRGKLPSSEDVNLPGLAHPRALDLNSLETEFHWRDDDDARVQMTNEEYRLHASLSRLHELVSVLHGSIQGTKYMSSQAEEAERIVQRILYEVERVTELKLTISDFDRYVDHDSVGMILVDKDLNNTQMALVPSILGANADVLKTNLAAIRARSKLPKLGTLEELMVLSTNEREDLSELFTSRTIEDHQLQKFQQLLDQLVTRAEDIRQRLQLPIPTEDGNLDTLKQLLDDPIFCDFKPMPDEETEPRSIAMVACCILLAVAAAFAAGRWVGQPGTTGAEIKNSGK